jgi:hypothetical protein
VSVSYGRYRFGDGGCTHRSRNRDRDVTSAEEGVPVMMLVLSRVSNASTHGRSRIWGPRKPGPASSASGYADDSCARLETRSPISDPMHVGELARLLKHSSFALFERLRHPRAISVHSTVSNAHAGGARRATIIGANAVYRENIETSESADGLYGTVRVVR